MVLEISNLDGKLKKYRIYDEDDLDPIVNTSFWNWEDAVKYALAHYPEVKHIYLNGDVEIWNHQEGNVYLKGE